jgi:hypothetical protein
MLGWALCRFQKQCVGTCYAELVFFPPVEYVGHVVHSVVSGARNINVLFSSSGGPDAVSRKKCARTCYGELLFLHPVGSAAHVVHSGAFRARNVNTLFFMLEWA